MLTITRKIDGLNHRLSFSAPSSRASNKVQRTATSGDTKVQPLQKGPLMMSHPRR